MRTEFIPENVNFASEQIHTEFAPWASVVIPVDGGWMAWESVADYDKLRAQIAERRENWMGA